MSPSINVGRNQTITPMTTDVPLFACSAANPSFLLSVAGVPGGTAIDGAGHVSAQQTVFLEIGWVNLDGEAGPPPSTDVSGLSVDFGAVTFSSSTGTRNRYIWSIPANPGGITTATFSYGENAAPCTFTQTVAQSAGAGAGGGTGNFTPLTRSFPGYGGDQLNDSLVNSVYFMTTLASSGTGSLEAAPSGSYIVPLVAGARSANVSVHLNQDNVRFLGQLAPGHISINGTASYNAGPTVRFNGDNALWEYLSLRASDVPTTGNQTSHKPYSIQNNNTGVVLSHISCHYGDDDSGEIWYNTNKVTLHRMLYGNAAYNLGAGTGRNPNYGPLSGGGCGEITMFQCLMMTHGRSPMTGNSSPVQIVNNLCYPAGTGGTNQFFAYGTPLRTCVMDFLHSLEVRAASDTSASVIWTGQASASTPLSFYRNNVQYRNSAGQYLDQGFTTSVADTGTFVGAAQTPGIPGTITDLTTLEAAMLPTAGNSVYRDAYDQDVIARASNYNTLPPVEQTASDYYANPWGAGPSGPSWDFWDQSSPDGISDAAKATYGFSAGTNLLSPNDGRWEGVVDDLTGGLLSASIA